MDYVKYTPSGAGYWTIDTAFNSRLQPTAIGAVAETNGWGLDVNLPPPCTPMPFYYPSTYAVNYLNLGYSYVDADGHNNGNVISITNNADNTRSQNFTYDSLNRLSSADTGSTYAMSPANCWGETYGYDAWGNLLSISPMTGSYTGCTQESGLAVAATAQNQISGLAYDTAGNLTGALYQRGSYDAENHLISETGPGGSATYTYDGDGKRVMKSNGTIYWYGLNSSPLFETDLSNDFKYAYFFFNAQRIARYTTNNGLEWYVADALGNTRFVWQCCNQPTDKSDYYPFGGERALTSGTGNAYKFAGKERDSESNLDNFGARYNSSQLGRFMSPDPENYGADPTNPQSWNMYAYVLNNPLTFVDPFGLDCVYLDDNGGTDPNGPGGASIDHNSNEGECNGHGGYWADGYIGSLNDVQTFANNDNALITSQNGADPEITVASQSESQGVSMFGNVPPSFWSGQFADPSWFDQSDSGLDLDWQRAAMTLNLAGIESTRYLTCAGRAAVANTIPFGGHLVGMGSAKSDAQDAAKAAATHPFATSKALNAIDLPNIGEAFVGAYKNPLVLNGAKAVEKAEPLISAVGFGQDFSECADKPQ